MITTKILLAGEGGQGIQTIAKVISNAAAESGKEVCYIPSFGVEQRGTPSIAFITISSEPIYYPRFDKANYVVILQKRAASVTKEYVSNNTRIIFDSSTMKQSDLPNDSTLHFGLPATHLAYEKFTPRAFNVLVAGKLAHILGLDKKSVWEQIAKTLGKKFNDEKIRKANEDAYNFGFDLVYEIDDYSKATFSPSKEKILVRGYGKVGQIVPERCKGCGICIEKCPVRALKNSEILGVFATPVPEVDLEKCITCGNCSKFCPDAAILVEKEKMADK